MKGNKKWREKKNDSIFWPTANPLQSSNTRRLPKYGTTVKNLVMTLAPQKDICPHGRTYPIKAVSINTRSRVTPLAHTRVLLPLFINMLRNRWM